ncbi:MAG: MFS transporter, partial [Chitinivibrionales bacterium]|nr:MFS transporter [Chitinivibrionales bacterium]
FFGKMIPKKQAAEFFGFYNIFGKFAAILGPLFMGIVSQFTGHSRWGVLSVAGLLIIGIVILARVENPTHLRNCST